MRVLNSTSPAVREWLRVFTPLALAAGLAWILLAIGSDSISVPTICSAALVWSAPSPDTYALFFAYVSPLQLAISWTVMVIAMMLPTLIDPLRHARATSFRRVRPWVVLLFVGGYLSVWIPVGIALLGVAITLRLAFSNPFLPLGFCLIIALIWQISPWKQVTLNRCHRRSSFATFPPAAYRNALIEGVIYGRWCIASCWSLMLTPLLAPSHHLPSMAIVAVCIWAERIEPARAPRWELRVPSKAKGLIFRIGTRSVSGA